MRWLGRRRAEIFNTALGHGLTVKKREKNTQKKIKKEKKPHLSKPTDTEGHGQLTHTLPVFKE